MSPAREGTGTSVSLQGFKYRIPGAALGEAAMWHPKITNIQRSKSSPRTLIQGAQDLLCAESTGWRPWKPIRQVRVYVSAVAREDDGKGLLTLSGRHWQQEHAFCFLSERQKSQRHQCTFWTACGGILVAVHQWSLQRNSSQLTPQLLQIFPGLWRVLVWF